MGAHRAKHGPQISHAQLQDVLDVVKHNIAGGAGASRVLEVVLEKRDRGRQVAAQAVVQLARDPCSLAGFADLQRPVRGVVRLSRTSARAVQLHRQQPAEQTLALGLRERNDRGQDLLVEVV